MMNYEAIFMVTRRLLTIALEMVINADRAPSKVKYTLNKSETKQIW